MRTLPYGTQKDKNSQAYGSGDGGGSNIVQGAHQPALPDCRRNFFKGGAAVVEGGRPASSLDASMARRISSRYSLVLSSTIPIEKPEEEKCSCMLKNQNYLKNKVKLKR